jgi:hypothetical protein
MATRTPDDFWPSFRKDEFTEFEHTDDSPLATTVAETFGLSVEGARLGSPLKNIDIKRMDALKVIRLSLLEASADDNVLYEPVMTEDGEKVEFKPIGQYQGFDGNDIYYEIQTQEWLDECGGVMIIGEDPLPEIIDKEWKPIWGDGESSTKEIFDADAINTGCGRNNFSQYASVFFSDPHEDSRLEDGIDNLYEITAENPWDRIIGYATFIDPGDQATPYTVVEKSNTSRMMRYVRLDSGELSLGTLQERPEVTSEMYRGGEGCYAGIGGEAVTWEDGVPIQIEDSWRFETVRNTKVDKLMSIDDIYVEGWPLTPLMGGPKNHQEAVNPTEDGSGSIIWGTKESTNPKIIKLENGRHYAIAYEPLEGGYKRPYVVFANNFNALSPAKKLFTDQGTEGVEYRVDPFSSTFAKVNTKAVTALVLPTSENTGIEVKNIFAAITLDTPSINIFDPDGEDDRAMTVAGELQYLLKPLMIRDEPPPVAFNGEIIDQTDGITDADPTTKQNFIDTEMERALDKMAGSGMQLNLGFLDELQCSKLSRVLYEYLNSGSGIEATYVCGPEAEPVLGGTGPNGGIVNSIVYSYQDQNSYTISVNCGSIISNSGGFEQLGSTTTFKKTEDVSGQGVVVQSQGDDIYFKVRVDGVNVRHAVNMTDTIIRQGDVVQVTIHNNPVED